MTREDRAREAILDAAGVNSGWIEMPMDQMLNLLLAFADAEAEAMRERCAKAAETAHGAGWGEYNWGRKDAATAIRALPLASPALRDDREGG